jgi:ribosomal-protein-alanine N-acetyltransferase
MNDKSSHSQDSLHIVRLKKSHAQALAALDIQVSLQPWSVDNFSKECEHQYAEVFGAFFDLSHTPGLKKLCAFAVVHIVLDEARLVHYGVHKMYQGQGIGRAVLQHIFARLRERHVRQLDLEVRETNEIAQKLYLAEGFHVVGRRPSYYSDNGEDALLMRKNFLNECQEKSA